MKSNSLFGSVQWSNVWSSRFSLTHWYHFLCSLLIFLIFCDLSPQEQKVRGAPVSLFVNSDASQHATWYAVSLHPTMYHEKLWKGLRNNWEGRVLSKNTQRRRKARLKSIQRRKRVRPRKTRKQQVYATRVARKPAYLRAILGAVLLLRNIKYQSRGQEKTSKSCLLLHVSFPL